MSRATVQHARARRAWSLASAAAIVAMIAVAVLGVLSRAGAQQDQREIAPEAAPAVWFLAFDIYVDSGATPLAAYQIEISASAPGGAVTLVGVEGGEHAAFAHPPYYDPAALHENALRERIVIAALSTEPDLPTGRTRVARLHVRASGAAPSLTLKVETAGAADGRRIDATATYAPADPEAGDRR